MRPKLKNTHARNRTRKCLSAHTRANRTTSQSGAFFLAFPPLQTLGGSPNVFLNKGLKINSKRNQFINASHNNFDATRNFSKKGVAITSRIHFSNSS